MFLARFTNPVKLFDCRRKQATNPLLLEKVLERFRRRNRSRIDGLGAQFVLGGGKVQRDVCKFTAAFLAGSCFQFVERKAVRAKSKIGTQPTLRGIEARQKLAFQELGKKTLREVLSVFRRLREFQANVFVNRLPITGDRKSVV